MKDRLDGWTWDSGDDDTEAVPGPPARAWYAVPRLQRTPAQSARAAGAWIRARWIKLATVVTVLALSIGSWQTYHYLTRFHEQMSGPHGGFPAALGTAAPERPGTVLASGDGPARVVGGLALHEQSSGIMASNVRTGRSYWHYGREKSALIDDSVVGDAVVLWYDDGLTVSVDLRSGKPRWHTKVAGAPRGESGSQVWRAGNDTVILNQGLRLTALSAHKGKQLWSIAPPKGCKSWDSRPPVDLLGSEAFDAAHCAVPGGNDQVLYGIDAARGTALWHVQEQFMGYGRLGDHTLVSEGLRDSLVTVDVSGTRPLTHTTKLSHEEGLRGLSDGMVLLGPDDTSLTARQVSNDGSSKALWTVKAGKGRELGISRIADGRVYIPEYRPRTKPRQHIAPGLGQLLVLDARTGHELHRTTLPTSLYENAYGAEPGTMTVLSAGYGVVRIGWSGFLSPSSTEQVILAD